MTTLEVLVAIGLGLMFFNHFGIQSAIEKLQTSLEAIEGNVQEIRDEVEAQRESRSLGLL